MPSQSSLDSLRSTAASRGVTPSDADLESVLRFLETIVPILGEIERRIPPETPPAGMFLPLEESP